MQRNRRPSISRRCPVPWTEADDAFVRRQIEALKADVRAAGGFEGWLQNRLESWLDGHPPCKVLIRTDR